MTGSGDLSVVVSAEQLVPIVVLTLEVTLGATVIGAVVGIPIGAALGLSRLRGRRLTRAIIYSLFALPPVVVGLVLYLVLRREGPLGPLGLLFTPWAILLGEAILTIPIVAGLTIAAIAELPYEVLEAIEAGGPTPRQRLATVVAQARFGIFAAVLVGFGRALAEVAAALIVGGNILGETRTLGTAILQEVNQGAYDFALVLAAILMALALATVLLLFRLQRTERIIAGRPSPRRRLGGEVRRS